MEHLVCFHCCCFQFEEVHGRVPETYLHKLRRRSGGCCPCVAPTSLTMEERGGGVAARQPEQQNQAAAAAGVDVGQVVVHGLCSGHGRGGGQQQQ